jgi:branched-chain amino acid aminotransferase/4-amino-4-deoxychorismate lyase
MKVIFNGNIVEESTIQFGINNRGLNYGDGLFETIIGTDLQINYLEDHLTRLLSGLEELKIRIPPFFYFNDVNEELFKLRKENNIKGLTRIKILVWRKTGGLFTPTNDNADFLITAIPTELNQAPKQKVVFYEDIKITPSPISRFKKLSSLTYVMAGIFKKEAHADDVILLDTNGNIAECLVSNIFWVKDNQLYTPALQTGCVEGIMRKQILNFFEDLNIKVEEGEYKREDLLNADFVFTSNVTGIIPVKSIEDKNYTADFSMFERIKKLSYH